MAPPGSGQKGTSKKNSAIQKQSRNSTPVPLPTSTSSLPPQEFYDPDYLNTRVILFANLTYDDLVDQSASVAPVPDSRSIDSMLDKLKSLIGIMEKRSTFYDRGMRYLADERKKRPDDLDKMRIDGEQEGKKTKSRRKKGDALAPNDSSAHELSSPLRESKRKHPRDNDDASSSLSPIAAASPSAMEVDDKEKKKDEEENNGGSSSDDDDDDDDDEETPPRRELPQSQTFGEDPSTFPDPTVYEILSVPEGMSVEDRKRIYSVATYPRSDLADLIAGDPPDRDFSNAKPTSQINFSTFSTYVDPYFRPFSEEDLAFLRERGDRLTPFVIPKRGKRHYKEIWAEEDGAMALDTPQQGNEKLPPNQPRGTIESMNDATGETDALSVGPILSRVLQALRPENRGQPPDDKPGVNGDVSMSMSMSVNGDDEQPPPQPPQPPQPGNLGGLDGIGGGGGGATRYAMPPAAYMTESSSEAWKKASHPKLDYNQVDERLKQELRHIGFLPEDGGDFESEYDEHYDDEVAARLRLLQGRLREQMLLNGARKARLMDLVRERMAHQEYQTILEDLDTQVNAAYLKRTRTMGKSKKSKRPGGAGGGSHAVGGGAGGAGAGMARPGIGDLTKTLMERRRRWIDTIGSVFDDEGLNKVPRAEDPESSIFKTEEMAEFLKREKEQWDDEVEG